MSTGEVQTEEQARAILGLAAEAPPSTWRAAFQREVKAAHPDRGGDHDRVRLVIEAYRYLKLEELKPRRAASPSFKTARPAEPRPRPRPAAKPAPEAKVEPEPEAAAAEPGASGYRPVFPISIVEAFRGGEKMMKVKDRRRFRVRLPAGLQTGDVVRFGARGEHYITIRVEPHPGA